MKLYQFIFAMFFLVGLLGVSPNASSTTMSLKQIKSEFKRVDKIPYPYDNKYSKAKDELGKLLFFDPRLSGSNVMSCATCHSPSFGWEDSLPLAVGHGHKVLGRGSPTILNLAWAPKLFWDGRANSLEEQALGPMASTGEMNQNMKVLAKEILKITGYKPLFEKAFPGEKVSNNLVAKAIATYERGIVSSKSPFDRWIDGQSGSISKSAKKGFSLFTGKANCVACHSGWRFTDDSFHDIGIPGKDVGRYKILKLPSQMHAFKTPTLRNIVERAPYMHDGSEKNLAEVVDFYNKGGKSKRQSLSDLIKPLKLTKAEQGDLIAFLKTLSSKDPAVTYPLLPGRH